MCVCVHVCVCECAAVQGTRGPYRHYIDDFVRVGHVLALGRHAVGHLARPISYQQRASVSPHGAPKPKAGRVSLDVW
jgi:hypothetical protein